MRLAAVLMMVVCGVADAQGTRWVTIGTTNRGDFASIDTIGVVRVDGFVNVWWRYQLANDAVAPGLSERYFREMERDQIDCRTRTYAVVQTLYEDREGQSSRIRISAQRTLLRPPRRLRLQIPSRRESSIISVRRRTRRPYSFGTRWSARPEDDSLSVLVRNSLVGAIEVSNKFGVLGTVGPQQTMRFRRGGTTTVTARMIPTKYATGQNIPNQFPKQTFSGVRQADTLDVKPVSSGGRSYFSPLITNAISSTITIEVTNSLGTACLVVVPPKGTFEGFGYYLLDKQAEVRAYVGTGCTGSPRVFPNSALTMGMHPGSGGVPLKYQ